MSYKDGLAALKLQMPDRVPHTEYSLEMNHQLVEHFTGIKITPESTTDEKTSATAAFYKALNYDFIWSVLTHNQIFGDKRTDMGHAVYNEGGSDYRPEQFELYDDPDDALQFDPWQLYGKRDIPTLTTEYNEHYDNLCKLYDDAVNMTGIYVTCISGLIEVFGWDILLSMAGISPKGFGEVANRYADWIMQYYTALANSKAPVVMLHDDIVWTSGAFLHPDWYRTYLFPIYKKLFAPLHEAGKIIMYTSDGTYTEFIDDIADCGVNAFVMEPTTDMAYIAKKYGKTHGFVGNADTRILLSGTKGDIYAEVKRCMDIGKCCPGFFMAVGNHIPPNTPYDSVMYYLEAYEKMSKR